MNNKQGASQISLIDYLLAIGEPLIPSGHNYYRHRDHDSLVISSSKNVFYWNSQEIGGGAIQYLMAVKNLTYDEARTNYYNDLHHLNLGKVKSIHKPAKPYLKHFDYKKIDKRISLEAKKYLVVERALSNNLVQRLIDEGYISEETDHENIVFKWFDENKLVGASLQGTKPLSEEEKQRLHWKRDYFKQTLPTTEKYTNWGFNYQIGLPRRLMFFESPIDMLSYWSLKPDLQDTWLNSLEGGNVKKIMYFLQAAALNLKDQGEGIKSIFLGFDRDQAGKQFIKKFNELNLVSQIDGRELQIHDNRPPKIQNAIKTDWNDYLKAKLNNHE